jgi:hypothetical protein
MIKLEIFECDVCGETKEVVKDTNFLGMVSYWCEDCTESQEG